MKLLLLFGNAAVGKMTVGQELMKLTDLRLFHNHMTIEPVLEVFGRFDTPAILRLRQVIFEEFAATDLPGMIFTFMWALDEPSDRAYVDSIKDTFRAQKPDTVFYHVELVADKETRMQRNLTENRLLHKPSKRDTGASTKRLLADDSRSRLESRPGELALPNYLRIDNTHLSAEAAALQIQKHFGL